MRRTATRTGLPKVSTGIPGFDFVAMGGLPRGRCTLVTGPTGCGKTVFSAQFLASGIEDTAQSGVFVTLEDSPSAIRENMSGFGWDIAGWEAEDDWAFVDVSPEIDVEEIVVGEFDFGALLARIRHAVDEIGAERVAIDSSDTVFDQFEDTRRVRREMFRVMRLLGDMGVTGVVTAEAPAGGAEITRHGIEEFVSDNVVVLRNRLESTFRQRTVEVLKFRGTDHQKGEFPFTIRGEIGLVVVPLSGLDLEQPSTTERLSTGIPGLDDMCGGGLFRTSNILVAGATGTGKSLLAFHFASTGDEDDRCLYIATEEGPVQLYRNAANIGVDLERRVDSGAMRLMYRYPEIGTLEDHLIDIKREVDEFRPRRLILDSMTALERITTERAFRDFVVSLAAFVKGRGIAGMFTSTTPVRVGEGGGREAHISTTMDTILTLRYVELEGAIQRGILVLKMRGSGHVKELRRLFIDDQGVHVGDPMPAVTGILSGTAMQTD